MAEEKKTTTKVAAKKTTGTKSGATKTTTKSTAKPTTKKVENNEEVKAEKRFCTKCGKELVEGEVCDCTKVVEPAVSINSDALINTAKNVLTTITNVFKKPDTTCTEEANSKDNTLSIILIVLLAISYTLFLMATVSTMVDSAATITYGATTLVTNNISYFKVFIYGILIYAIMAVIPIFAAFIIGKITRNGSFNFKKAFKLYTISNAPLIYGYLGMALIVLLDVALLNVLGIIAFGIISVFCLFNFLLGFNKETTIREDRRSWAITSVLAIWVVIEILALALVLGSAVGDTVADNKQNTPSYNYNNRFNW